MTNEILGKVHQIVNTMRVIGAQYNFLLRQSHPEKGGASSTHSFSKVYLKKRYASIKKEVLHIGLKPTFLFEGKSNETMQIHHEIALTPHKVNALLETYNKQNNNQSGLNAIVSILRTL